MGREIYGGPHVALLSFFGPIKFEFHYLVDEEAILTVKDESSNDATSMATWSICRDNKKKPIASINQQQIQQMSLQDKFDLMNRGK